MAKIFDSMNYLDSIESIYDTVPTQKKIKSKSDPGQIQIKHNQLYFNYLVTNYD